MNRFDYVIVGGGTAGCVLAARLSQESGNRVALVEAGPAVGPERMSDPAAAFTLWGSEVDWGYSTAPQPGTCGAVHPYPLGRVLGGSSSINAALHLRGDRTSYDAWQRLGADGWNYDSLLPYLRRCEGATGRDPGPLAQAWSEAATEAGYTAEYAAMNVVDGRRHSAADGYLRPVLNRPNLMLFAGALVTRLVVSGTRCTGIEYRSQGAIHALHADREVLIAAGAIGSPHLLIRSGIGDADELTTAGIPVRHHLPGVGKNLHDHVIGGIVYQFREPLSRNAASGPLPYVVCRSQKDSDPDIQLILNPGAWAPRWGKSAAVAYSIMFALMLPASRGTVRATSGDPTAPPVIDPGLLTDEHDLDRMVRGLRLARRIGAGRPLRQWFRAEITPGAGVSGGEALRDFIRSSASTYFHPVGSCRMGSDTLAVVDNALRVRGIDGLRVADASVMPTIVSANTNATVLAIAERAAEIVGGTSETLG
ncbi:GMC family oxidoreductase [Mycobacterium sp. 050134]|uniref:GMC family oxidoreductase n=1 Tax=Mycobacterium sp. 050134 TaxID=3096111 RepID=UPI002ED9D5F3